VHGATGERHELQITTPEARIATRLQTAVSVTSEVLSFTQLMWALDQALQTASRQMREVLGLTGPQRLALRVIAAAPGISAGGLAEALHLRPSDSSGVLQQLERRGLIERRSDSQDARRALFGLTATGRTVNEEHERTVEAAVHRSLERLSPEHRRIAKDVLRLLTVELTRERASPNRIPETRT
jgi:MarR family transcriptional regulator, organic hydroperoxide resistance regulator